MAPRGRRRTPDDGVPLFALRVARQVTAPTPPPFAKPHEKAAFGEAAGLLRELLADFVAVPLRPRPLSSCTRPSGSGCIHSLPSLLVAPTNG